MAASAARAASSVLADFSEDAASWKGQHVVSISQFKSKAGLRMLLRRADFCRAIVEKDGGCKSLEHRVLATVFYEPSTRTSCSFAAAMLRMGGGVVPVAESTSSAKKGESLADTIRTMACYCDAIVLRHPAEGAAMEAARASPVPVLNAGDGTGEHPTQALLDLYTVRAEIGRVEGLTVTLLGDLKHGRTVHSLAALLALYGVRFHFVSPEQLAMPDKVLAIVREQGCEVREHGTLTDAVLAETDVLYVTRIQRERFASEEEYLAVRGSYVVDSSVMAKAKATCVVMHPLPRVTEIAEEVDSDPRAAYFRQMRYGLFVRMALLDLLLGGSASVPDDE